MEQPKISVTTDGEIDVSTIDEILFVTLYNRLLELHRKAQNAQVTETKNAKE
ncbi:MAG: hypothetical protein RSB59_03990 [Clostridia bacterium]